MSATVVTAVVAMATTAECMQLGGYGKKHLDVLDVLDA